MDRIILVDGGGELSAEQMGKVFAGIKPSLDRLGKTFPSFEDYLEFMKQTPFLDPWSPVFETYFRYEAEDIDGGVRSRTQPEHIQEEAQNLRKLNVSEYYSKIACRTLILRATEGLLAGDDILLPEEVTEKMLRKIPGAVAVTVQGVNHYMILFQPNDARDRAILSFLEA
ncbi:hypothetical protein DRJ16_06140 [Candidatus Woesearchaeota archaeon]|nr:MAG: hypothetical protein DRJ16_06140 [Candidatus Woesearchaeota archaeon]